MIHRVHCVDGKTPREVDSGQVHKDRSTGNTSISSDVVVVQLAAASMAMAFNLLNLRSHVDVKHWL